MHTRSVQVALSFGHPMLRRISLPLFVGFCALSAAITTIVSAFILVIVFGVLIGVLEDYGIYLPYYWHDRVLPGLLMAAACICGFGSVVVLWCTRYSAAPASLTQEAAYDALSLDGAERGLINLFPNERFLRGLVAGGAILDLLAVATSLFLGPRAVQGALIGFASGIFVFFILFLTISQLPKLLLYCFAGFYLIAAPIFFLTAVDTVPSHNFFLPASYGFWTLIAGTLGSCWFVLGRLSAMDRLLLHTSFSNPASIAALETYVGLPPVFGFMPTRKRAALGVSLGASLLFSVAFLSPILTLLFYQLQVLLPKLFFQHIVSINFLVLIVVAVAVPASIAGANALLTLARSYVRFSIDELVQADPRPPILFLRAFYDDQVALPGPRHRWIGKLLALGQRPTPLDQLLVEEVTPYGPVVALGNPRDRFPPYGAARGYFANKDWQQAVTDLAREARAIVLCVDETDSVWWEIGHIGRNNYLHKTLFVLPPKYFSLPANVAAATRLLDHLRLADEPTIRQIAAEIARGGIIALHVNEAGRVKMAKSNAFTQFSYLALLRWFFRTKFGFRDEGTAPATNTPRPHGALGVSAAAQ